MSSFIVGRTLCHSRKRRKVRLIEGNAKRRHLKELTWKGVGYGFLGLRQVNICRKVNLQVSFFR